MGVGIERRHMDQSPHARLGSSPSNHTCARHVHVVKIEMSLVMVSESLCNTSTKPYQEYRLPRVVVLADKIDDHI